MLREIHKVRQIPGEPARRWFTDEQMDLFVWLDGEQKISGFQLSYDKSREERAITWKRDEGLVHTRVDDGSRPGQHPGSPLLVADRSFDISRVVQTFLDHAGEIDQEVTNVVASRLGSWEPPIANVVVPDEIPSLGIAPKHWRYALLAAVVLFAILLFVRG